MSVEQHWEDGTAIVEHEVLLLIDTCGERGSVALFRGEQLLAEEMLSERTAAAALVPGIRSVLETARLRLGDLRAVGVVNGPGSFTGVRVGLAVAKGLCEGAGLMLGTVSRLAVLAEAGGLPTGFAMLRAGRDQLYVRDGQTGSEQLMNVEDFLPLARDRETVYAEPEVGALLGMGIQGRLVAISAKNALHLVRRRLREGGSSSATADANYVRDEGAIYKRAGAPPLAQDRPLRR